MVGPSDCVTTKRKTIVQMLKQPPVKKLKRSNEVVRIKIADPEGHARKRGRDLVDIALAMSYVPQYYASHTGRGMWQDHLIKLMEADICTPEKQGKVAILTIDMKSKTKRGKHLEPQGYNMGGKGMSLQGGMLKIFMDGKLRIHYVDAVYVQQSNQVLEEAMTGLAAQLHFIREHYPSLEEVWVVSDKCSNFNEFYPAICPPPPPTPQPHTHPTMPYLRYRNPYIVAQLD